MLGAMNAREDQELRWKGEPVFQGGQLPHVNLHNIENQFISVGNTWLQEVTLLLAGESFSRSHPF